MGTYDLAVAIIVWFQAMEQNQAENPACQKHAAASVLQSIAIGSVEYVTLIVSTLATTDRQAAKADVLQSLLFTRD